MNLTVNGVEAQLTSPPLASLLHALREEVGVTSPKAGCQQGGCGACTVLVDGVAVNACCLLAVQADRAGVETVSSLGSDGALHPLQQELVERGAVQCGFCTPGIVLGALEAVRLGLAETGEEIRRNLAGNLCRCTGYQAIVEAVEGYRDRVELG